MVSDAIDYFHSHGGCRVLIHNHTVLVSVFFSLSLSLSLFLSLDSHLPVSLSFTPPHSHLLSLSL